MKKVSCALMVVVMIIGILPFEAFALGGQNRSTPNTATTTVDEEHHHNPVTDNHDEDCHHNPAANNHDEGCHHNPATDDHSEECHNCNPATGDHNNINPLLPEPSSKNDCPDTSCSEEYPSCWESCNIETSGLINDPNDSCLPDDGSLDRDDFSHTSCNEDCPSYGEPTYTEISDLIDQLPTPDEVMEMSREDIIEVNRNVYAIRDMIVLALEELGNTEHNCFDIALGEERIEKYNSLLFYTDEYIREHVEISRVRSTSPTRINIGAERIQINAGNVERFATNSGSGLGTYAHNPNGYILHGTYSRQVSTDTLSWRTVTVAPNVTTTLYFDNLRITNTNTFPSNTNNDLRFICVDVTGSNTTIILLDGTTNVLTGGIREGGGALVKNNSTDGRTLTIACERWEEPGHMCTGPEAGALPDGSCGRLEAIGFTYHSAALGSTRDIGGVISNAGGFGNLHIKGGIIVARNASANSHAPGIGSMCGTAFMRGTGLNFGNPQMRDDQISRDIHISGGRVFAYGGRNCSGIGSGWGGIVDGIHISDGAYVKAQGGQNSPGIGSGGGAASEPHLSADISYEGMYHTAYNVSNITISGGRTVVEASGSNTVQSPSHSSVPGIGSGISAFGRTGTVTNVQAKPEPGWLALVRAGTSKEDANYINGTPSLVNIDILPDMYYTLVHFSGLEKTASVNDNPAQTGSQEDMIPVKVGDRIRYTITNAHWSSDTNSSYTLTDVIPPGMTLVTEAGSFYPEDMTYDTTEGITTVRWENRTRAGEFFFTVTVDDTLAEDETREYINEAAVISSIDQLEMPSNRTYHYAERGARTTTLTVSKEVTGDLGNRITEFEFTIFFQNSDGSLPPPGTQFHYTGETLAGLSETAPANGTLTLDDSGSASFTLAHGQAIRIEDVPLSNYVQIIEATDKNYKAWLTDSIFPEIKEKNNDTGSKAMTENRAFHFENERDAPPPTGINLGGTAEALLLFALVSVPAFALFLLRIIWGRRRKLR